MQRLLFSAPVVLLAACGGTHPAKQGTLEVGRSRYTQATFTLIDRMGDGKDVEVGHVDRSIAELAGTPVVLDIVTSPLQGKGGGGGGPAIGIGSFGGGGATDAAPKGAAEIDAWWESGTAAPTQTTPTASLCDRTATCVVGQTLRIVLAGDGAAPRTVERTLLELPAGTPAPTGRRRYVVDVFDGAVTDDDVDAARAALDAVRRDGQPAIEKERAGSGDSPERRDHLLALDAAGAIGRVIATQFAAMSDRTTDNAASLAGASVSRPTPRVLITSFSNASDGPTQVSLDLRLDEVEISGDKDVAAHLQLARGLTESRLEGMVLSELLGSSAMSTARVMDQAQAGRIEIRGLMGAAAKLPDGVPAAAAARIRATLADGHQVLVPAKAVAVDGKPRWGWWDIDPATMRTIGVMEDGEHQAFTEYNEALEKLGLSPNTGFMIGMLIGSDYTAYAIVGAILERGKLDKKFLESLEAALEGVACTQCPTLGGELKVEGRVGDCFKTNVDAWTVYDENFSFCERYNDGFKCAAQIMIKGNLGEFRPYEASASAKIKLGCEHGADIGTGPASGGGSSRGSGQ